MMLRLLKILKQLMLHLLKIQPQMNAPPADSLAANDIQNDNGLVNNDFQLVMIQPQMMFYLVMQIQPQMMHHLLMIQILSRLHFPIIQLQMLLHQLKILS